MKRRVLVLIPTLTGGGAERVIVTLLRHMDRSKFDLALAVVDTRNAAFLADLPMDDIEFIDLKCARVRYALPKIIWLMWQRRPDVVFSTLGHLNLALAMVRNLLPRDTQLIAREATIISHSLSRYSWPRWWAWAYRRFYGRVNRLVCQSIAMRSDLVERFGFPAEKTNVINNPCDIDSIRELAAEPIEFGFFSKSWQLPDTIKLVAAGRLEPVKGFEMLIDAIALCADPRIHLLILGEGPLREQLVRQAEIRGISSQMTFVGFQRNPYAYFAKADAFVLSSRFEGFPNVVLEALACGTPVVATPAQGGTREILDSIPECMVAKEVTTQALANVLNEWLAGRRNRVGATVTAPYRVERIIGEYEMILLSGEVPSS